MAAVARSGGTRTPAGIQPATEVGGRTSLSPGAAGSGPEGAASTEGSNASPQGAKTPADIRREAYRLRTGQRGLVYDLHRSLACCGLGRLPIPGLGNSDPEMVMASLVTTGTTADLQGLTRCASPWSCPVCAPRVASLRARVLAPQVQARLDAGWTAWLITLTVRHGREDPLDTLFAGLSKAWSRVTSGKAGKALRRLGSPEYIRGLDLTWSSRNGWHPHVHVVVLLPPGHGDGRATATALAARWRSVLGALGYDALPGAQDVQPCRDAAQAAAYATTPAAVYEAVGIGTKTARNPRAGLTAFDLLRAAVPESGPGDSAMIARWCEYVAAVKGRRQTTVSRGLTLDDDKVLMDEEPMPEADCVAMLGAETISELDRARRVPELLEAVEFAAGDREAARRCAWAILGSLRARDWYLVQVQVSEPAELPASTAGPSPPLVPEAWSSPETAEGRVWRPMTGVDRAHLARLALTAP